MKTCVSHQRPNDESSRLSSTSSSSLPSPLNLSLASTRRTSPSRGTGARGPFKTKTQHRSPTAVSRRAKRRGEKIKGKVVRCVITARLPGSFSTLRSARYTDNEEACSFAFLPSTPTLLRLSFFFLSPRPFELPFPLPFSFNDLPSPACKTTLGRKGKQRRQKGPSCSCV